MKKRGFYGVGVYHPKTGINIGGLFRTAQIFNADWVYTIGRRYSTQASDTMKSTRHIPLYHFESFDDFYSHMPKDCRLIGVELYNNAKDLKDYSHPERACYLLGAEDNGLPPKIMNRCHDLIRLAGERSMNVATAGSIVIYHRMCL